ncbi:prepilin peptidase [Paenibacillus sp. GCM10023248]|uniref:A24 family peptidase n=1 Tax=Bacillales TaxID=1385 RepID=UPI002378ED3B|nr:MULTISPECIES: A24 family peptidase [Bacillales]MDD9267878.1 A24 family peptidase [Paenibacillus sp. MAHUQ-63]MDR6882310.1 prepilin peptidase CpaA [Bacillus sp. 3255]
MSHSIFVILLVIAFVTDVRKAIIPNKLTICGLLAGVGLHTITEGWGGLLFSITGAASACMSLLLLYAIGALGAGDVKLFTAIGALMGFSFVIQLILYSILSAGVIGLVLIVLHKKLSATSYKLMGWIMSIAILQEADSVMGMKRQSNMKFPFMYAVVPGTALTWYYSFV